jgi:hypothetical protein
LKDEKSTKLNLACLDVNLIELIIGRGATPVAPFVVGRDVGFDNEDVGIAQETSGVEAVDSDELVKAETDRIPILEWPPECFRRSRSDHGLAKVVTLNKLVGIILEAKKIKQSLRKLFLPKFFSSL